METRKITLPSGAVAELKKELTAGDVDDIQDVYYDGLKIRMVKNESTGKMEQAPFEISPSVITKQKYKLLSVTILNIEKDGKKTSPVTTEYLRGLSISDVDMLEKECGITQNSGVKTTEELGK